MRHFFDFALYVTAAMYWGDTIREHGDRKDGSWDALTTVAALLWPFLLAYMIVAGTMLALSDWIRERRARCPQSFAAMLLAGRWFGWYRRRSLEG